MTKLLGYDSLINQYNIQILEKDLNLMLYLEYSLKGYELIDVIHDEYIWRKKDE